MEPGACGNVMGSIRNEIVKQWVWECNGLCEGECGV